MKTMAAGLVLSAMLALAPLPGLPTLPDGTEIRVVSPDLRAIYLYWLIDHGVLDLRADPLDPPEGAAVRILIRIGRDLHVFEGQIGEDDIYIFLDGGYVSLRETFSEVYHLRDSERTLAVWQSWEERRSGGGSQSEPKPNNRDDRGQPRSPQDASERSPGRGRP